MRAGDRDRALVQQVLGEAYAEGRLERDELDERSEAVQRARTLGELVPFLVDIVPARPVAPKPALVQWGPDEVRREALRRYDGERRSAVLTFVGPSLICWAVWTATSWGPDGFEADFPWPLIVMAATLFHLVQTLVQRRERVEGHMKRIEREQAKALRKGKWPPPGLLPGGF